MNFQPLISFSMCSFSKYSLDLCFLAFIDGLTEVVQTAILPIITKFVFLFYLDSLRRRHLIIDLRITMCYFQSALLCLLDHPLLIYRISTNFALKFLVLSLRMIISIRNLHLFNHLFGKIQVIFDFFSHLLSYFYLLVINLLQNVDILRIKDRKEILLKKENKSKRTSISLNTVLIPFTPQNLLSKIVTSYLSERHILTRLHRVYSLIQQINAFIFITRLIEHFIRHRTLQRLRNLHKSLYLNLAQKKQIQRQYFLNLFLLKIIIFQLIQLILKILLMQHSHGCFVGKKHLDSIISRYKELSLRVELALEQNRSKYQDADGRLIEVDYHVAMRLLYSEYLTRFEQNFEIFFGKLMKKVVVVAQILYEMGLHNILDEHLSHLVRIGLAFYVRLEDLRVSQFLHVRGCDLV